MNRDDNIWAQFSRYSTAAMILPAGALVGGVVGYLLDRHFHTRYLTLIFLLLGIAGGFVGLLRELDALTKRDEQ